MLAVAVGDEDRHADESTPRWLARASVSISNAEDFVPAQDVSNTVQQPYLSTTTGHQTPWEPLVCCPLLVVYSSDGLFADMRLTSQDSQCRRTRRLRRAISRNCGSMWT